LSAEVEFQTMFQETYELLWLKNMLED